MDRKPRAGLPFCTPAGVAPMTFALRPAVASDMPTVAAIYRHWVETSCATFEEVPPTAAEMTERFERLTSAGLPWLVATAGDGPVLGYAYVGPFRQRSAYRYTIENSVYIAPGEVARGIGSALMRDIIAICAASGYRQMMAVIGDSANEGSLRLHARLGFRTIGHLLAVGLKFGQWVDVVEMQLTLGDGSQSVPTTEPCR